MTPLIAVWLLAGLALFVSLLALAWAVGVGVLQQRHFEDHSRAWAARQKRSAAARKGSARRAQR